MSDLFSMFSNAMPESMKKQEEELLKKKEKELTKKSSSNNSNKSITPAKPRINENDKKQIVLPVVVYYAREKLVLECHPDDMVVGESTEEVKEQSFLETESEETTENNSEVEIDDDLENDDSGDNDTEETEEDSNVSVEEETKEEPREPVELGQFMNNINLRIIVPSRLIEKGKISKEDARVILQREYPELSKDRTVMDYDKENAILVPIVKAAVKGMEY